MAAALQITMTDMAPSAALESRIRARIAGLEKICPRISSVRVTMGAARHHQHGARFFLKLDVRFPGMEIVVMRDQHEDLYLALREAVQAARRQLREHVERGQGADKSRRAARLAVAMDEAQAGG